MLVDTVDAGHEAGDLLRAGLDVARFASLADVVRAEAFPVTGPVLFKSCGWAGWDLAAARTALAQPASAQYEQNGLELTGRGFRDSALLAGQRVRTGERQITSSDATPFTAATLLLAQATKKS